MGFNDYRDFNNQFLPISRSDVPTVPDFSDPPQNALGDEVRVTNATDSSQNGWWKCVNYSVSSGYSWYQITTDSSSGGGSGLSWQTITASTTLVSNTGYTLNNTSSVITLTLPSTASLGAIIVLTGGVGCVGFIVQAGASQQFIPPPNQTTSLGGTIFTPSTGAKSGQGYRITIECVEANTLWLASTPLPLSYTQ